jgi:hypothetical protein
MSFLLLLLAVIFLAQPRRPLHDRDFDRIELGMSRNEVEAILGVPPGIHLTGAPWCSLSTGPWASPENGKWKEDWICDDGAAVVIYDSKDGKVESKYWNANTNRRPGPVQLLLDKVHKPTPATKK